MLQALESAFRLLLADEYFTTLLRPEGLTRVPTVLCDRVAGRSNASHHRELDLSAASDLLRSKNLSPTTVYELERMVPSRQEEFAILMLESGCFISPSVRALVGACDQSRLANPKGRPRRLMMKRPDRDAASTEIGNLAAQFKELRDFAGHCTGRRGRSGTVLHARSRARGGRRGPRWVAAAFRECCARN